MSEARNDKTDAERYRYLRANHPERIVKMLYECPKEYQYWIDQVDAEVDHAMAADREQEDE